MKNRDCLAWVALKIRDGVRAYRGFENVVGHLLVESLPQSEESYFAAKWGCKVAVLFMELAMKCRARSRRWHVA